MAQKDPSSQTTLVVLLGASQWPYFPDFQSSIAFANSANRLKEYLLDPRQFGLPAENLLDLFDANQSADVIDSIIGDFLDHQTRQIKTSENKVRDLLVYYVGHGGFVGPEADYYLAIRRTRSDSPRASSLGIASLADTLKEKARRLRRILILDCCFAAAAFKSFQSGPGQVAKEKADDAFKEEAKALGYPERGTALLCSSGPKVPSLISQDGKYTIFTDALLRALITGNARQQNKPYISLRELTTLTTDILVDSSESGAPRPYLLSPDQSEGDVADIPFFPNHPARIAEDVRDNLPSEVEKRGKLPSHKKQSLVQKEILARMQVYRSILLGIRAELDPINFPNIGDIEIKTYQRDLDLMIKDVTDPENRSIKYDYIKEIQGFEQIGKFIIRILNNALFIWRNFQSSGISNKDRFDGERAYQDRLDECFNEIGNLLAEFKDF